MPKRSVFARIAITLPRELLAAADRHARALDRSRSWVIAEAIRRFAPNPPTDARGLTPRTAGLGESRRAQLVADLRLSPEERVREAEETLRATETTPVSAGRHGIVAFDRFEDYLDWKRRQDAGA